MENAFSLEGLFTLSNLFTFLMLVLLQAVLGFDNLLYITIESRRVEASKQAYVRRMGIGIALGFRLILLFVILFTFNAVTEPLFGWSEGFVHGEFTLRALLTLAGGAFIIWTAMKEIFHLLSVDHLEHAEAVGKRPVASALALIVIMNLVFSFDSLLSAVALSERFLVIAASIVVGGILMIWLSDHVARFLEKNRAYEVVGLFILLVVGILLVTDGGHLAHLTLFGYEVHAMSKASFYFVIFIMVGVSVTQSKYRNKLMAAREEAARQGVPTTEPDVGLLQTKENSPAEA
ncbi:TerC family protein [Parvularcula marina]|nr:tellurium resistance protein TerC [Parvularcula marina]